VIEKEQWPPNNCPILNVMDMMSYLDSDAGSKGGGALCAGNAVALLVFGPVMP